MHFWIAIVSKQLDYSRLLGLTNYKYIAWNRKKEKKQKKPFKAFIWKYSWMKQSMRLYVLLRLQNDKTCLFSRQNRNFLPIAGVHLVKQAERQRRQLPRAPKLNTQQRNTHQEFSAHFIGCIIFQLRVRPTIFFLLSLYKQRYESLVHSKYSHKTYSWLYVIARAPCTILVSNIFLLAVFFSSFCWLLLLL